MSYVRLELRFKPNPSMDGGTVNKFAVQGIGYNLVLTTLGGMRELVGQHAGAPASV